MSNDDAVAASIQTNRLTVHDAAHLPAVVGDGTLFGQALRLDTGDGWIEVTPADGGLAVERIDAPEDPDE
jgi:hypothetical protein